MGFSRQGYWSGLPSHSPEDLPDPGIKPRSSALQTDSLPSEINPEYSLKGLMLKLWPPDAKSRLIGKDPDAGNYWGQEEKRTTEDEMVGWRH